MKMRGGLQDLKTLFSYVKECINWHNYLSKKKRLKKDEEEKETEGERYGPNLRTAQLIGLFPDVFVDEANGKMKRGKGSP